MTSQGAGRKVLVTSANGNLGRELLPRLSDAGLQVRALRSPAHGENPPLPDGASEVFVADLRDADAVGRAVDGVDAIVHISPVGISFWEREIGATLIEAAERHGVDHFVMSSVLHPMIDALLQHQNKLEVEDRLISSSLNWTILQPADYMQMAIPPSTFTTGELAAAWSVDRRQTAVDLADVAEVAVKVLTEGERHHFARYELCGLPQSFNAYEAAEMIGRVCGREIEVKPMSGGEFLEHWGGQPGPPIAAPYGLDTAPTEALAFANDVVENICNWYNAHDFLGNPNVLEWLLGRPPTTLEEYVSRLHAAAMAY